MLASETSGRRFSRQSELWLALLLTLASFALRVHQSGFYSLSEDEAAKWQAIQEYRQGHFVAVNGEHPMLMKLLAWGSLSVGERWNGLAIRHGRPTGAPEAWLRLPNVILGAATTFVLYLLARSLLGNIGALAAASFWAFSPLPIALNRLLKEETPLVFFSLLGCYFYLRAKQATQETQFQRRLDLSAVGFGLSFASKYAPQLFGLNALAWFLAGRRGLGAKGIGSRFPRFFVLIAITFLLCNPVVVVPADVQSMLHWIREGGAQHTGYNLAGTLYLNQPSLTQATVPWYFYAWLLVVKTPLPVLAATLAGSALLLRRRDSLLSAFFLSFGAIQFIGLSAFPAKWIRYFLSVLPFLFLAAGYAVQQLYEWLSRRSVAPRVFGMATIVVIGCACLELNFWDPYYSLYLNALGGGTSKSADYFSPDEMSELDARETAEVVSRSAPPGARLATSKPKSMSYYLDRDGRKDIEVIPLYDPDYRPQCGDLVLEEESRRYFETAKLLDWLRSSGLPHEGVRVGPVLATTIYYFRLPSPSLNDHYAVTNIATGATIRSATLLAGNLAPPKKVEFPSRPRCSAGESMRVSVHLAPARIAQGRSRLWGTAGIDENQLMGKGSTCYGNF
jgi:4-amino-4-deoxy-L-arabinose transferase-like glycosyltransferase